MTTSTVTVRFTSPLIQITDIACNHPRGGCGCERGGEPSHLTLLRRNGFGYHISDKTVVGDPATALLHRSGDTYRISHPFDGGDDCTTFEIAAGYEEEIFGNRSRKSLAGDMQRSLSGHHQWAHLKLHALLQTGEYDTLGVEELVAALCESILRCKNVAAPMCSAPATASRLVQRTREALLADPTRNMDLEQRARVTGCSPFHLAHIFRHITGRTMAQYRMQLRISLALERLMAGESDLSALAQDLGFSHHSHFSAAFRRYVGVTPSTARESARPFPLRQLRKNLIA